MVTLKPDECRVLGVLIEKAQTTPQQYPLTLNALTTGCNQKNNRHPVVEWDEDRVMAALDSLRLKGGGSGGTGLVREAMLSGSRVAKFRHLAREGLGVDTHELVVLAELLLRGPQSLGELRQNASRMHAIDSLEQTKEILDRLMNRPDGVALVREHSPPPGSRAKLYSQLLCPDLHRIEAGPSSSSQGAAAGGDDAEGSNRGDVLARIASLESRVAAQQRSLERIAAALGDPGLAKGE